VIGLCSLSSSFGLWSIIILSTLCLTSFLAPTLVRSSLPIFFTVSEVGSLLFFYASYCAGPSSLLLSLSLLLKLGFAPFQFWVFRVLPFLSLPSLFFLLAPSKVGFLYLYVSSHTSFFLLSFVSLLVGLNIILLANGLHIILYASGSVQLLFLDLLGPSFFLPYYSAYFIALLGIVSLFYSRLSPLVAMLCLGGLPPLPLFWGKLLALSVLSLPFASLMLLSSSIALFSYVSWALTRSSSSSSSISHLTALSITSLFLTSLMS